MTRTVVELFDISTEDSEWLCQPQIDELLPIILTAEGVIVYEDEHLLKLAPLYHLKDGRAGVVIIVPKGCIISRRDF